MKSIFQVKKLIPYSPQSSEGVRSAFSCGAPFFQSVTGIFYLRVPAPLAFSSCTLNLALITVAATHPQTNKRGTAVPQEIASKSTPMLQGCLELT